MAALLVVTRHACYESGDSFMFGAIGVDLFFIISGFVMATLAGKRTTGRFIADRLWRIFPIYWLLVSYDVWVVGVWRHGESLGWAAANLVLVSRWFGFSDWAWNHTWTLVFELAFYLLVALGIWLRNWRVPLLIFVACLVVRPFTDIPLLKVFGSPLALEFLLGAAVAILPKREDIGVAAAALAVLWLLLFPNSWLQDYGFAFSFWPAAARSFLWGVPSALLAYGCLANNRRFGRWATPLVWLGFASYSVYLIHINVVENLPILPWWVLAIGASWIGFAVWYFIERPLLAQRRTLVGRLLRNGVKLKPGPHLEVAGIEHEVDAVDGRGSGPVAGL